jgi:putative acetyltransferase
MPQIDIRKEQKSDQEPIWNLTKAAFKDRPYAGGDEQDVINKLRSSSALVLSLVAEDEEEVIGQITFSPAIAADGSGPWFALGPVSVIPSRQGEGVGGDLIKEGLRRIEALGSLGCILTGDPNYYYRFGFKVSPESSPEREPAEYFQLRLQQGSKPDGRFSFNEAFYEDT